MHSVDNSLSKKLQAILDQFEGEPNRGNYATRYAQQTPNIFKALISGTKIPIPQCVQLEITNTCSTGCKMCRRHTWVANKHYTLERELSTTQFLQLFDELAESGVCYLVWSGGEPITHPDFAKLLIAATQRGLKIGLFSNGVDINADTAKVIIRHASWLRISQDDVAGNTFTVRKLLQSQSKYTHITTAIRESLAELKQAQNKFPQAKCNLGIAYMIQRHNVYKVPDMAKYATKQQIITTFKIAHGPENANFLCDKSHMIKRLWHYLTTPRITTQNRLVFIVGLQKSGTTLLLHLLLKSGLVSSPFRGEGHDFWGDIPAFSPQKFPSGHFYQNYRGNRGHKLDHLQATEQVKRVLWNKLRKKRSCTQIVVNKNPYNTLRLSWLRAIFPQSIIVAIVRKPKANVFSLLKKFISHPDSGVPPEHGWWGVKPPCWRKLVRKDKIVQCAQQWQVVNTQLLRDQPLIDIMVRYHQLCATPQPIVERILQANGVNNRVQQCSQLRCQDDEYRQGAAIRSHNQHYWTTGDLTIPKQENIQIPPLTQQQQLDIEKICHNTAAKLDCLE